MIPKIFVYSLVQMAQAKIERKNTSQDQDKSRTWNNMRKATISLVIDPKKRMKSLESPHEV